jgi:hypothetical protein
VTKKVAKKMPPKTSSPLFLDQNISKLRQRSQSQPSQRSVEPS